MILASLKAYSIAASARAILAFGPESMVRNGTNVSLKLLLVKETERDVFMLLQRKAGREAGDQY